jgi:hypothetical protein
VCFHRSQLSLYVEGPIIARHQPNVLSNEAMKEDTMKRILAGGACVTLAMTCGLVAFAQTPSQTPQSPTPTTQSPTPTTSQPGAQASQKSMEQQVTIAGCVQREEDYRKANNLGRGGAVGTGVGVGNEFVLINVSPAGTTADASAPKSDAATGTAGTTGAAGASAKAQAYELTGSNEGQVAQYVGRRVEIVGKLKAAESGPAGPTGGATAGTPPSGVDVTSPDLKLKEVEVTSVRESTGTCPSTSR